MNKVVVIGNGFDLAHGMPTRYVDFLKWYFVNAIKESRVSGYYNSELIYVEYFNHGLEYGDERFIESINTISDIFSNERIISEFNPTNLRNGRTLFKINYKSDLLRSVIKKLKSFQGWVDIEKEYYVQLQNSINNPKQVGLLNSAIQYITNSLCDYITKVQSDFSEASWPQIPESYREAIKNLLLLPLSDIPPHHREEYIETIYVNFNYTNTLDNYLKIESYNPNIRAINIHGQASEKNIIFGFGDALGEQKRIFKESENDLIFKNIKQLEYPTRNEYEKLKNIIEAKPYDLFIFGHSCGLSDAHLISDLIEHPNCKKIKLGHYNEEDFRSRVINIYRILRDNSNIGKITSYEKKLELPQANLV